MMEVLSQVSDLVKQNYYDPKLKNLDWKADVEVAQERIRRADHEGEMAAAISGLLARLEDSHTYFLRPMRLQPVIFGFRAKAFGGDVRVYEVMRGGPAEEVGLQRGDKIIAIEDFSTNRGLIDTEMRYFQYLDPRLTMKLKITRNGGVPQDFVIKGRQPANSSKEFVKLYEEYRKEENRQSKNNIVQYQNGEVIYLTFPSFEVSASEVNSILKKAKAARALILDLRDDGGGREDTMKNMVGHFFAQPTRLCQAISRNKKEEIIATPKSPNLTTPLLVLVDSHSGSAAEIVARVLQMQNRATVVGDLTAGKVNRAEMFGGRGGSIYSIPFGVAITVSRAVLPDGSELEGRGVRPDEMCVPTDEDLRLARDPCLDKALSLARRTISKASPVAALVN
jgi:carboxyl-terminal processing protease